MHLMIRYDSYRMSHILVINYASYSRIQEDPYLPKEVLWRQKEQFSDGVGYSWIDQLKSEAESKVTDLQMKHAESRFPV